MITSFYVGSSKRNIKPEWPMDTMRMANAFAAANWLPPIIKMQWWYYFAGAKWERLHYFVARTLYLISFKEYFYYFNPHTWSE